MAEGMSSKLLDRANKLYSIGMKAIKVQMALLGTDFIVKRPKNNSKWKNVFGGTYSSDSTLENDFEEFTTRLIINQNEFRDVWNRNRDTLESFSPNNDLEVGDEVEYTRNNITFRFKVALKQAYSETAEVLYIYTLSSIIETINE